MAVFRIWWTGRDRPRPSRPDGRPDGTVRNTVSSFRPDGKYEQQLYSEVGPNPASVEVCYVLHHLSSFRPDDKSSPERGLVKTKSLRRRTNFVSIRAGRQGEWDIQ